MPRPLATPPERVAELAQMLGGTGDKATETAEEILGMVQDVKKKG